MKQYQFRQRQAGFGLLNVESTKKIQLRKQESRNGFFLISCVLYLNGRDGSRGRSPHQKSGGAGVGLLRHELHEFSRMRKARKQELIFPDFLCSLFNWQGRRAAVPE